VNSPRITTSCSRRCSAIPVGVLAPPIDVTLVDAHADLGLGDGVHMHLMTEVLFPGARDSAVRADRSPGRARRGNHLVFAVARRWINDLTHPHTSDMTRIAGDVYHSLNHLSLPLGGACSLHAATRRHRAGSAIDIMSPADGFAPARIGRAQSLDS
jgi:hypothetical protein